MKTLKTYLLVAIALLATLVGCGPGTGGTGTGPSIGSGNLVAPITYSTGNTGLEKSAIVVGPTSSPKTNAVLALEPQRIELRYGCQTFVYVGDWTVNAIANRTTLDGTFTDSLVSAGNMFSITSVQANIELAFEFSGTQIEKVNATVKDSTGLTLMGPFTLGRANTEGGALSVCSAK